MSNVNLTIDGKSITVPKGTTVYQAAKSVGIEIPIFCYQDRMPPFGACRMCLVEVEKMGKLQASCTLEVAEGMVVQTKSQKAEEGREGIVEFLLLNHPLDCPICDRGGECPLQENALDHGPGESRFFEEKRRFPKATPLGPVLMLDRERCIVCARCTRFGDIIAGDHALEFIDRGYKTEVGTPDGGPAKSKFIGNTIQICPVGALTSQVYRFRARPWDNEPTESTCTLCPVGCSLIFDARDGEIMRTRARENLDVNDMWLCDKGWFGYEFVSHPDRLKKPLIKQNGTLQEASWEEALSLIATQMSGYQGKDVAAFGGNPLTVEENYLFQKLMREGAKTSHIDHRIGMSALSLEEEGLMPGMDISIGEMENLSTVFLLGLDLTEEFPVLWLRLKQAINKGAKVVFIGHYAPEIASHLADVILHPPGDELKMIEKHVAPGAFFIGRQYLHHPERKAILAALMEKKPTSLNLLEGKGNSFGARFAGMRPDLGPQGKVLEKSGLSASQVMEKNEWNLLYIAGANPATKYRSWEAFRKNLKFLVVQDLFLTETAKDADVVLPTLCYAEKGGSFINLEGRVQTLLPGKEIPEGILSDGEIFTRLALHLHVPFVIDSAFLQALKVSRIRFNRPSQVKGSSEKTIDAPLRATFAPSLFDHGVRMLHDTKLVELAKIPAVRIHPEEGEKRGFKTGEMVTISASAVSFKATLWLDENVAKQTVVLPLGFSSVPAEKIAGLNGTGIEIKK